MLRRFLLPAIVVLSVARPGAQAPTPSATTKAPASDPPAVAVGVLYGQFDNASTTNIVSQQFEAGFAQFDSQAADDFTIPAGTFWRVTEVDVDGSYFNGAGPAAGVNVTFYSNAGGSLPGVVQCSRPLSPFAGGVTGDFVVTLSSPCVLGPGVHWVAVQARMDFGTAGEWGIQNRTVQAGSGAAWINPANGFGTGCTGWTRAPTCVAGSGPDLVFRILGTVKPMVVGDFDGNSASDYIVARYPSGPITWYALGPAFTAIQWGNINTGSTYGFVGDYDGDDRADPVVCDASPRICYVRRSSNGTMLAAQWGLNGDDSSIPGDYDGDGLTDFAAFRFTNGAWYVRSSIDGSLIAQPFGTGGDRTAAGDYDGDGRTDFAVWRPSTGTFYFLQSTGGFTAVPWGASTDHVITGDFDGDGKADPAVGRQEGANLVFYIRQSSNGALLAAQWGLSTDVVAVGDYDGDKKTDIAVWRNGVFYVRRSSNGTLLTQPWGQANDSVILNYNVR